MSWVFDYVQIKCQTKFTYLDENKVTFPFDIVPNYTVNVDPLLVQKMQDLPRIKDISNLEKWKVNFFPLKSLIPL